MSCKFELEHIGINQANADEAAKAGGAVKRHV